MTSSGPLQRLQVPFVAILLHVASAAWAGVGSDLTGLGLCFYGDCDARGSWVADPYGWTNPATWPVVLDEEPRVVFGSASYFKVNVGDVSGDLGSGVLTAAYDPVVFQAVGIYGHARGAVRDSAPLNVNVHTRIGGLGAAVDLGRTRLGLKNLSLGLLVAIPGLDNDLDFDVDGVGIASVRERRGADITFGAHWRGGEREWFMVGAFVNGIRNDLRTKTIDPETGGTTHDDSTNNAWFARAGFSLLPFVPLALADSETPLADWLDNVRLGADVAHVNLAVPGEDAEQRWTGYWGVDARVLPDQWNPLVDFVRLVAIAGVDSDAGWGIGAGIQGRGPLAFMSCNPGYSSRPIAKSLGDRFNVWSATCTLWVPL